jgi:hypothetical protein
MRTTAGEGRGTMPLQMREAPIGTVNLQDRTAELAWTTGARVQRYDWMRDRPYLEELSLDPKHVRMDRLASGKAPLLNSHGGWMRGLESQIGVVDSATIKPPAAAVRFSARDEVKPILQDVADKIIRNVSVGYVIHRLEMIPPTTSDDPWVYRAIDWEPYELSLVTIPADAGAEVRAQERTFPCEFITPAGAAADHQPQQEQRTMKKDGQQGGAPAAENSAGSTEANREAEAGGAGTGAAPAPSSGTATAAREADTPAIASLYRAAEKAGIGTEFVSSRLEKRESVETIRNAMIDAIAAKAEAAGTQARTDTNVQITEDEVLKRRGLIVNALLHRADPTAVKLVDGAGEWRGYTLRELMRELLEIKGVRTRGMSANQMWERTMLSGSDLPNIVLDAANKTLRNAYDAAPRTYEMWARQVTAPDFKNINRTLLSGAPNLQPVLPGEEFKRGIVSDGKETYALATYGRIIPINRQTIINDDMQAFTRLPALMARAGSDLIADTVYAPITGNVLMADGVAIFSVATHANLTTGPGTVINVANLGVGRAAMRVQKGVEGRPINVAPKFLIIPVALETLAEQYTSADFVSAKSGDVNVFKEGRRSALTVVAEPRLDAVSALSWYLAADNAQIDTVEYAFLEGQEGIYLESRQGWDIDGIELKARVDVAAKCLDYRGLYKNAGA